MNYGCEVRGSLEPYDAKVSSTVLRGGDGGNVISLSDSIYRTEPDEWPYETNKKIALAAEEVGYISSFQ
jgi:hypothetical protein